LGGGGLGGAIFFFPGSEVGLGGALIKTTHMSISFVQEENLI
jgi:hypothetical protein